MTDAPKEIFLILSVKGGSLSDCFVSEKAVLWESHEACLGKYIRADLAFPKWQPIETAPRDGTRVLLYADGYGQEIAHYEKRPQWAWDDSPPVSQWLMYVETLSGFNYERYFDDPTHWRPLDKPPVKVTEDG